MLLMLFLFASSYLILFPYFILTSIDIRLLTLISIFYLQLLVSFSALSPLTTPNRLLRCMFLHSTPCIRNSILQSSRHRLGAGFRIQDSPKACVYPLVWFYDKRWRKDAYGLRTDFTWSTSTFRMPCRSSFIPCVLFAISNCQGNHFLWTAVENSSARQYSTRKSTFSFNEVIFFSVLVHFLPLSMIPRILLS